MKKYVFGIFILSLVGCGRPSNNSQNSQTKKVGETAPKTEAASGTPGISLHGAMITLKEGNQTQLDNRISVAQFDTHDQSYNLMEKNGQKSSWGSGYRGIVRPEDVQKSEFLRGIIQSADLKEFINLGCKLESNDTAGLTEKKLTDSKEAFLTIKTSKVFICGKLSIPNNGFNLIANEVVMRQAEINNQGPNQFISISANRLIMSGQNSITSRDLHLRCASSSDGLPQDAIAIIVIEKLVGDGTLALSTHVSSANQTLCTK